MSKIAAGIDLGTTNSKIAVFKGGKVEIVPNLIGDTSTPSIVAILDNEEAIGEETILHKVDEKHLINQIKRLMGKNISDLEDFKDLNYKITGNNNNLQIEVNRKGKIEIFTPEQITALIIQKLIKSASDFVEGEINKVVIAVPTYFDSNQRTAMEHSAKIAGIEEVELMDEPTAAALGYGLGKKENLTDSISFNMNKENNNNTKNIKVLVFDLGGATFDVSILTIKNTDFNVIAKLGDIHLGGIDFDNKLINFCLNDFCQKMNIKEQDILKDINALKRLRVQCEKGKKLLSKNDKITINIYNFFNGHDLTIEITRTQFDEICEEFYIKIENILNQILIDSKFSKDDINDIILVGGSSKIPKIREILLKIFDSNKIREKVNQDEAVVIGATWKSHYLAKKFKNLKVSDILSHSLGVGSINKIREERKFGLIMSVLIPKGSEIPAHSEIKKYKTVKDNQKNFKIKVYSGEDKIARNNRFLGEIIIDNLPPGRANSVLFTIRFDVDKNGILTVNAEVSSTEIKIQRQFNLYDDNKTYLENSNTIICLSKNSGSKKKLDEIRDISKNIEEKNKFLDDSQNDNDKIKYLNELCEYCLKIINIYNILRKNNDSENLYEKYFYYTKLLFKYYSKIIIFDKEENNVDILNKIQKEISCFINDNIENIIESFEELKTQKPKIYIEIILYIVEILFKEGDRILKERKKYAKYYSTKFYKKAEQIKNIIDDNLKKKMDLNLRTKLNDIEENYGTKLSEINAFTCTIENQLEKKNTKFLPKRTKSGITIIENKINSSEDIFFIIDIYQEMANSLSKGPPSEKLAYCIANIIIINFTIFKNYNFKFYEVLNNRINYILDRLPQDEEYEDDDDENNDDNDDAEEKHRHNWYKQLIEVNEKIAKKKKEIEDEKKKHNEIIKKDIELINKNYNDNIQNNKPNEFIFFILENYPYINFKKTKFEDFKQKSLEELLKEISPNYHPDNYKDRNDYKIYHEIYMLLVNIENKFIKKV